MNNNWIPVSKGLPRDEESVLIQFSGHLGNITYDHAFAFGTWYEDEGWYIEEFDQEKIMDEMTVEAWMELPEVWEGSL